MVGVLRLYKLQQILHAHVHDRVGILAHDVPIGRVGGRLVLVVYVVDVNPQRVNAVYNAEIRVEIVGVARDYLLARRNLLTRFKNGNILFGHFRVRLFGDGIGNSAVTQVQIVDVGRVFQLLAVSLDSHHGVAPAEVDKTHAAHELGRGFQPVTFRVGKVIRVFDVVGQNAVILYARNERIGFSELIEQYVEILIIRVDKADIVVDGGHAGYVELQSDNLAAPVNRENKLHDDAARRVGSERNRGFGRFAYCEHVGVGALQAR